MTKQEETEQLLQLYKMKCFGIAYSCDDTEVEDNLKDDMNKIEDRILELVGDDYKH